MLQDWVLLYKKYKSMQNLPSKQEIIKAVIYTQKHRSKKHSDFLITASKIPDFQLLLLTIGFEQDRQPQIRYRVLCMLKQFMSKSLGNGERLINDQAKCDVKALIIPRFMECRSYIPIRKAFMQIISLIIRASKYVWNPLPSTLQKISEGWHVSKCLLTLLAVAAAACSFYHHEEVNLLATAALPIILQLISNNKKSRFVYLSIKFLWKIIKFNSSKTIIRSLAIEWMPILLQIVESKNPEFDQKSNQVQNLWSEQFFYFRSKKWATRIVLRYIQSHTRTYYYNQSQQDQQFCERWYSQFGDRFVQAIFEQFTVKTIEKVRYFQLQCFQKLFSQHQEKAEKYAESLMYDTLFNYLKYQASDEELALKEPIKFINKLKFQSQNSQKVRYATTNLWLSFFQLGNKDERGYRKNQPSPKFKQHLLFLNDKLQGGDERQKEAALYLLGAISPTVKRYTDSDQICMGIVQTILPFFHSPNVRIRARALEVFQMYGFPKYQANILNRVIKSIYSCIFEEEHDIVRIRAISVLSLMAKYKQGKELIIPFARESIFVALEFIQRYAQQTIVQDLEIFLTQFSKQIPNFALELIQRLWEIYLKITKNQDDDQEQRRMAHRTAHQLRVSIRLIIDSPLAAQTVLKVEDLIIQIIETFIMKYQRVSTVLDILNSLLPKVQVLTQKIFFFFQVIVYCHVGFTSAKWKQVLKGMQQRQVLIIKHARKNRNHQCLLDSFPVLKKYISKVSSMEPEHNYRNSLLCLLFHLISTVYKMGPLEQIGELNISLCTSLMASLLQSFQKSLPKNVYIQIWEFSKLNMIKFRSARLKCINSQLFGMLLWADTLNILTIVHRQNMLKDLVYEITRRNYDYEYQRMRIILGINSILLLPQKPLFILPFVPELFRQNLDLVGLNIDQRFELQQYQASQQSYGSYQMEYYQQYYYQISHQQDICSLQSTDEILQFQRIVSKIRNGQLAIAVPQEDLNTLRQKLDLAISLINSNQKNRPQ